MSKRYPRELRERIVEEFRQGRSVRELADDYEPGEMTIRKWVRRTLDDVPEGSMSVEEELKRLRRENRRLKEDRMILEKAAAWFAAEKAGRGRR